MDITNRYFLLLLLVIRSRELIALCVKIRKDAAAISSAFLDHSGPKRFEGLLVHLLIKNQEK